MAGIPDIIGPFIKLNDREKNFSSYDHRLLPIQGPPYISGHYISNGLIKGISAIFSA